MSTTDLVMLAVVVLLGAPAAWRNPTAAALVVAWSIGIVWSEATGDNIPIRLYLVTDGAVLGVIFIKACSKEVRQYAGWLRYCAGFLNKSWGDRIVIGIFPVMWFFYAAPVSEDARYWALWGLAIAQFVAAAGDAVAMLISRRRSARDASLPPGSYRLASGRIWAAS